MFITSRIGMLECRCKPLREQDSDLLALYDHFFSSDDVIVEEIDAAVVERATTLRAALGFKVPEHFCTPRRQGCIEAAEILDNRPALCPLH